MSKYILVDMKGQVLQLEEPSNHMLETLKTLPELATLICISGTNPTQYKDGDWYGVDKG